MGDDRIDEAIAVIARLLAASQPPSDLEMLVEHFRGAYTQLRRLETQRGEILRAALAVDSCAETLHRAALAGHSDPLAAEAAEQAARARVTARLNDLEGRLRVAAATLADPAVTRMRIWEAR